MLDSNGNPEAFRALVKAARALEQMPRRSLVEELEALSDERRLEIINHFCSHCGGKSPCQCWNDE